MPAAGENAGQRIRVLHVARNYPNSVLARLGLWTQRLVRSTLGFCEAKVVAPVPWCPRIPGLPENFARFRRIERQRWDGEIEAFHPRFLTGPGLALHSVEAGLFYRGIAGRVAAIRQDFPFQLIHAHFVYPDGVAAARLARRFRVPLVITEHAAWRPWLDNFPRVRRQALRTFEQCAFLMTVSRAHRDSIAHFTGDSPKLRVIPNVVDDGVFGLAPGGAGWVQRRILFVGQMRHVKGVDVLLRALRVLRERDRDVQLAIAGESLYEGWRRDQEAFRRLVVDLQLNDRVHFLGGKEPAEVAREMQRSALLVLPSRRESFGVVLAEALACGVPVVATRCGGPEDIVTDEVGVLVPPEDPEAIARGIEKVLDQRQSYDPIHLHRYSVERFGSAAVGGQLVLVYRQALGQAHP
jgi:glycosyltransferase involved in cell wall biosynthesis